MRRKWYERESKHFLWEIILVIGAVLIFRGAWTIMDRIPAFNTTNSLFATFFVGLVMTVAALYFLMVHEKEH